MANAGRTVFLTLLALCAFATNSLLCRMALGGGSIDSGSFTLVRISSGAAMLFVVSRLSLRHQIATKPHWRSALALFAYAISFSVAYLDLSTGTGALILFGTVQTTMLAAAVAGGERLNARKWVGLAAAVIGLVCLVLPGLAAPSLKGAMLMSVAGVSWGLYSLWGRGATNPVATTTTNFARAVVPAVLVSVLAMEHVHVSRTGITLAVASGAIASGLGYVAWYAALTGLTAVQAATVQLAVPVIAAMAGVVLLAETITVRLVLSSVLVLGGVALALAAPPANQR